MGACSSSWTAQLSRASESCGEPRALVRETVRLIPQAKKVSWPTTRLSRAARELCWKRRMGDWKERRTEIAERK
jgi:hypothetical protein